jgi:LAS superfamily LD-carboxypeptidase LdcB
MHIMWNIIKNIKIQGLTALIAIILIVAAFVGLAWYFNGNIDQLSSDLATLSSQLNVLETRLSSTTADLSNNIARTSTSFSTALNQERQNAAALAQQLGNYQQQVSTVSSTVSTLQKLSQTDPELLQKYSKVFFLNEYYAPARLAAIPGEYEYSENKQLKLQADTWPHLQMLIDDARRSGITIYVFSAYRSFNEQSALKNVYKVTYGAGTANTFSADQGYSEHQLGTAVDLITPGLGGVLDGFDNTKAYEWLLGNAYKYGFVISYPKNNTFYVFEPWHWRFVGTKLANDLHTQGKNFYDLDQREIDKYLVNFFD